jgi:hypothetical protein
MNIKAVSVALLLFVYPILVLSAASVHYIETIHRVTMGQTFDQSLFGSQLADSLAALGFLLLFTSLAFRSTKVRIASLAIFAAGIALYAGGSDLLQAVGIATLPALAVLLAAVTIARKKSGRKNLSFFPLERADIRKVIGSFLIIIIILEIGALARWISYPIYPTEIYSDPSWSFAQLESSLFHSLGLLSPLLVVLIAFSFLYKWFITDVLKKIRTVLQGSKDLDPVRKEPISSERRVTVPEYMPAHVRPDSKFARAAESGAPLVTLYATKSSLLTSRKVHLMILSVALVVAPLVALYPHLPGINPEGIGVSTDEQYYMNWMSKLRADSTASWTDNIASAFTINKGDRPLTLLLILTIANLTGSPDLMVVRFLPVALAPMLVAANYVLLRYSLKSKDEAKAKFFASLGAIFAVFSPQIVVGEYAGLLANWLALVVAYFAFYFLIRGWESQSRNQMIYSFGALFALLIVMMLVHLYTWAHLLSVVLLFAGMSYIFARKSTLRPKIKIIIMLAIVVTAFSIDNLKSSYFVTPAASGTGSAIGSNVQPEDVNGRWNRLFFTLHTYVGGFLSNPVLLLPALIWMVRANLSKGIDRLLLSMFFILAVPIVFGSIEFQTRVLYNIPLQIPALLILMYSATTYKHSITSRHLLLIIAISLALATYTLRAMANLYLELPPGYVLEDQFLLP